MATKAINVRIDADLHDQIKHHCIDKKKTITQVVTEAFEQILDEEEAWKDDRGGEDGTDLEG